MAVCGSIAASPLSSCGDPWASLIFASRARASWTCSGVAVTLGFSFEVEVRPATEVGMPLCLGVGAVCEV